MESVTEVIGRALRVSAEDALDILAATSPWTCSQDSHGLSLALFTREGKMVTHGKGHWLLTGLLPSFMECVLGAYPLHTISPGDFIIANDPYSCGSSLPVIMGCAPVYYDKRPLALVASAMRHADVGGAAPGGMVASSRDIFQEGLLISPVKAFGKGLPNEGLMALLSYNARSGPDLARGIKAQYWAARSAEKMFSGLAMKYGPQRLKGCMDQIIADSRRRVAAMLQSHPEREFSGGFSVGGDPVSGHPLNIQVEVKNSDGCLRVDFTGTSAQVAAPLNSTLGTTLACVYTAAGAALDPGRPLNYGLQQLIKVTVPRGSLLNPVYPAPVSCSHFTAQALRHQVDRCLSGLSEGSPGAAGFTIGGFHGELNTFYSFSGVIAAGQEAGPERDGGISPATPLSPASVEKLEAACPVMVSGVRLVEDSGGAGKFRGGPSEEWSLSVLEDQTAISAGLDPMPGTGDREGGLGGGPPSISVGPPGQTAGPVPSGIYTGHPGQGGTVTLRSAGGDGFGPPPQRDPALVRRDVLEGLVSVAAAREIYRVALAGESLEVDMAATEELRGQKN